MRPTLILAIVLAASCPFGFALDEDPERTEALDSAEPLDSPCPAPEASNDPHSLLPDERAMLFPLVDYERENGHTDTKVLDFIVGEGVHYQSDDEYREVEILDIPFATFIDSEEHTSGRSSLEVVDVPLFTLLSHERDEDGAFDTKFIKLPIIGSLFRHKRTEDKEKIRFLIFSHTRDFSDGENAPSESANPRRAPRRANRSNP